MLHTTVYFTQKYSASDKVAEMNGVAPNITGMVYNLIIRMVIYEYIKVILTKTDRKTSIAMATKHQ